MSDTKIDCRNFDHAKMKAIADAMAEARGSGRSLKEYNFCESCAMSLEFCDCVTPKPIEVDYL